MDHDLVSLKILIVSESAPERQLIRRVALDASIPIDVTEVAAATDAAAGCAAVATGEFDAVFIDSRMPKSDRQQFLDAIRAAKSRPLALLVGAAALKTREVLTDGLPFDGVLAKPIEPGELQTLIDRCSRARVPNQALIVDDSSTVRSVIRKVLQASRFRFNIQEAAEGQGAIQQAQQQRYDIVFLDCHMPGIDGFAALTELKRIRPESKVVMITGTRDVRIEDRARSEGASDFLYKPFFANDIDAVLSRLFGLMRPRWN
jgi:CheY-like chemotaxis protein